MLESSRALPTGRLFKVTLEGHVLGVIGRSGRNLGQFSGAHQLACRSETEVYVAETSNWRAEAPLPIARMNDSLLLLVAFPNVSKTKVDSGYATSETRCV